MQTIGMCSSRASLHHVPTGAGHQRHAQEVAQIDATTRPKTSKAPTVQEG
jgi:hypothetical protein